MGTLFRWLSGRGASQARVRATLETLSGDPWRRVLARHPFLRGLNAAEEDALRTRTAWILASKSFVGVQGLRVTPRIQHSIAVQAALPILGLDTSLYEGWSDVIIYPGGFLVPRTEVDDAGVVHEYVQATSGESWEGGPVILSWEDARADARQSIQAGVNVAGQAGANVVIHEFAHKLDQRAGSADGMPFLGTHQGLVPATWRRILEASLTDFIERLDAVEEAIPAHIDLESERADEWYARLPLDPYAASDPAEFFAVSSEAFFVHPAPLAHAWPDWYGQLRAYYRQDPLRRLMAVRDLPHEPE